MFSITKAAAVWKNQIVAACFFSAACVTQARALHQLFSGKNTETQGHPWHTGGRSIADSPQTSRKTEAITVRCACCLHRICFACRHRSAAIPGFSRCTLLVLLCPKPLVYIRALRPKPLCIALPEFLSLSARSASHLLFRFAVSENARQKPFLLYGECPCAPEYPQSGCGSPGAEPPPPAPIPSEFSPVPDFRPQHESCKNYDS